MGTTYMVKLTDADLSHEQLVSLQQQVQDLLDGLNAALSTYIPESEISRLNSTRSTEAYPVSPMLAGITEFALDLSRRTGGAFDPTVGPLVGLWGFGSEARETPPTSEELASIATSIGYEKLHVLPAPALRKDSAELQLDLSAIAKGYAVDEMANLLRAGGFTNYYVDIGGDGMAGGVSPRHQPWRIGIEVPAYGAAPGANLHTTVPLADQAIATSGDYRQFRRDEDGAVRAHIIDPRTHRPAEHALASVTVVANSCMAADAMATALYVLGPEAGMALVEESPATEALFIERDGDNSFRTMSSSGFPVASEPATP